MEESGSPFNDIHLDYYSKGKICTDKLEFKVKYTFEETVLFTSEFNQPVCICIINKKVRALNHFR